MADLHLAGGAYALDALADTERAAFERHLRSCPSCREEVAQFQEVTAVLAARVAVAAPARLRSEVLAQVRGTRQQPLVVRRGPLPGRPGAVRLLAAAAGVSAVVGLGVFGAQAWQARQDAQQARVEAARMVQVMTDPNRAVFQARAGTADVTVVEAGDAAVVAVHNLPSVPHTHVYQLWAMHGAEVRSLGVLPVRQGDGQVLVSGIRPGADVAVSVEPQGGSSLPSTDPLLTVTTARDA